MSDKAQESGVEYPINQHLIEEATEVREHWRVIRDRLEKIDEHKENVSEAVYGRVKKDYAARLQEATDKLLKKKSEIDRELTSLAANRGKINGQLEEMRAKLEEIKFRNTLGEFSEQEYQAAARESQDKISKFETILSAVDANIERYESIFKEEAEFFDKGGAKRPAERAPIPSPVVSERAEIPTDESGTDRVREVPGAGLYQEDDYFGAREGEEQTNPNVDESVTSKAPPEIRRPGDGAEKRRARVLIVTGSEAGAAYPIKGTLTMGRAESNTISLRDAKVSRQHAQIQEQGNEYVLVDLNSSNGTQVNGERIEEHVLSNGDEIQIGDVVLQFQL